jgi:superfamily I DNA and/or RNA helicase
VDANTTSFLPALVLIDTAGCGMEERVEEEGDSTGNPGEARVAFAVAKRLVFSRSVKPTELGIIAPYSAQVGFLRELRAEAGVETPELLKIEISTVDGFQGREKDAIVLSATRSNEKGDVGFLADKRRMNVAVTRARMHCVLVCDTDTVGRNDAFLRRLVAHFEARGAYVAASEFDGDG